ncbi:MAG: hypothetical protein C5B59_10885 [Bacteroidetes bacterium]|nr:MAG: hypothetical protein C5B59_10885 [Bacteroidota bacterium]
MVSDTVIDTIHDRNVDFPADSTLEREFDVYKFENDSLIQLVYVRYLKKKEILLVVRSENRRTKKSCQFFDTAFSTISGDIADPSTYEDELKNGELYPIYEYECIGDKHTIIGIEPSRGMRLSVSTGIDSVLDPSTPIRSVGTLRRIKLSKVKQKSMDLPSIPK